MTAWLAQKHLSFIIENRTNILCQPFLKVNFRVDIGRTVLICESNIFRRNIYSSSNFSTVCPFSFPIEVFHNQSSNFPNSRLFFHLDRRRLSGRYLNPCFSFFNFTFLKRLFHHEWHMKWFYFCFPFIGSSVQISCLTHCQRDDQCLQRECYIL